MKNRKFWFIFLLAVLALSFYEIYPPTSRDLIQQFTARAEKKDAAFTNILQRLNSLQSANTNREFANLQEAVGTNDIQSYFPMFYAKNQLYPTTFILNQIQRDAQGKIKLGLDLQGGTSFLVEMDTNVLYANSTNNSHVDVSSALSQAVEVLRKRVDALGVAEPVIQPAGENRILIQLPGLAESVKEDAKKKIQAAAYLEFCMVKDDSDQIVDAMQKGQPVVIPPGYEILKHINPPENGKPTPPEIVVVKKKPELAGDIVESANASRGQVGEPLVEFRLTPDGTKKFAEITKNNIGRRMAIILDNELYSAPVINSAIELGSGEISGHFTPKEAQELANVLQNPLRAPLSIAYSRDVDPTLGKDSIRSGIRAAIIAVILVSAFMLCYYWIAGITANIALITNIIILLGVMCAVGTTLTLPGIAGVVLTIGMAVDANVLIYERLREELAKGKSLRGALAAGYARAFGTIFDSHVTTLISSVILFYMGTGEIKGFGATLTIGIAASLFTSLVVTRLIFNWLLDRNILKSLPMMHIIRSAKVNFMKIATPLFIISWTFIILSLGYGFTRGDKLF
ncbi:MAG TPA: protein translocase subunit SecD, partial [Verrucomicrobiae bacterium]|nr:protein translocase subunit SecD [Verrucomicrobiae bacterium]